MSIRGALPSIVSAAGFSDFQGISVAAQGRRRRFHVGGRQFSETSPNLTVSSNRISTE